MAQREGASGPLDALVITRERIQEVLDDAVERGRMTRDDATELFGELVRRGAAPASTAGDRARVTGLGLRRSRSAATTT